MRRGEPVPQPDPTAPQRATLVGIPLFHTTGSHAILGPALYNGAKETQLIMDITFEDGRKSSLTTTLAVHDVAPPGEASRIAA